MDSLTTSVQNSTINSIGDFTVYNAVPVAGQCRDRRGYHSHVTYNIITCAFCYIYVYDAKDSSVSFNYSSLELVIGNNAVYAEGTRMTPDLDNPESVSFVCGSLKTPSECWKWQECCRQARNCCQKQTAGILKNSKDSGNMCPGTWDGYGCWPETPAGERPNIMCPDYVPRIKTGRYAYKTCTKNATWYVHPNSKTEWTDYTDCSNYGHYERLYHTELGCNSVTVILLVPACIIFLSYRSLRQQHRIKIHLCLMVSSLMTSFCYIGWNVIIVQEVLESTARLYETIERNLTVCRLLVMLSRYFEIASFMWMFIEGFHLHRLLVHAFSVPKTLIPYYVLGFGFPLLPVTAYAIIRGTNKQQGKSGWIDPDPNQYDWLIATPSLAALSANVFFLLRIVFIMVRQLEPHPNEPSNFRRAVKAVVVLVPLFGIQILAFIYQPPDSGNIVLHIYKLVGMILSRLQGAFIVIAFCYLNKEVQGYLKSSCKRLMRRTGPLDLNSRSCTVATHLPMDSSRNRIANGYNDSSHVIPLKPVYQHSNPEMDNTKMAEDNIINYDLNTIPENFEEGLLLNHTKFR